MKLEKGRGGGVLVFFFFNDTATTEIYTLSLHDALPICLVKGVVNHLVNGVPVINGGLTK